MVLEHDLLLREMKIDCVWRQCSLWGYLEQRRRKWRKEEFTYRENCTIQREWYHEGYGGLETKIFMLSSMYVCMYVIGVFFSFEWCSLRFSFRRKRNKNRARGVLINLGRQLHLNWRGRCGRNQLVCILIALCKACQVSNTEYQHLRTLAGNHTDKNSFKISHNILSSNVGGYGVNDLKPPTRQDRRFESRRRIFQWCSKMAEALR
jgi:hypothetical protein